MWSTRPVNLTPHGAKVQVFKCADGISFNAVASWGKRLYFASGQTDAVIVKSIFALEVRIRRWRHQMFEDESAASLKEVICFTQPGDKDILSFNLD